MEEALIIATEKFKDANLENIPARCGVDLIDSKIDPAGSGIKIKYLARWYLVSPDTAEVTYHEGKDEVSNREKLIILHYLTADKTPPLSGKLIDFREIPSGNMYYPSFENRTYQPFLALFDKRPALFAEAAAALEGEKTDFGDNAFKFMVLPRIPIHLIMYEGDEEFPAACKVLFDSSIKGYLPTEDIAIVCEDLTRELKARGEVRDFKVHS